MWKDSVSSGSWNNSSNWTSGSGTGYPGAADTAIFTKDAEIINLENPSKAAELKFTGNATNPWPLAAVLGVFAIGVLIAGFGNWRYGAVVMAAATLLAGVARMLLPRRVSG